MEPVENPMPVMASHATHRESWDSLSSTFANLEVSFSQDSCYGSDEVSVSSNNPAPLPSSIDTCTTKHESSSLHPILKSILKNSNADYHHDTESESGYGSDDIEFDYDAFSDEDDDDDLSDFSVWEDTPENVPETREDRTDTFDDSFIGFEPSVQFDPIVQFIDTPDHSEAEDEPERAEMTCHEMMLLSLQSGGSPASSIQSDVDDISDDEGDHHHKEFIRNCTTYPEDFTHDAVDVDRQLFVAYMNGIHGIADAKYKTYLHAQADNIRMGHEIESMHPDDAPCMYLDLIQSHVIGVFRNLLCVDELNELIGLRKEEMTVAQAETNSAVLNQNHHHILLDKVEHLLLDRLTNGRVDMYPDELSFFAGGVVHALGTQDLPAPT
ncbi:hypothetical protein N7462_007857 [Penicillium macrosclerotiorum]|uniref:uncharacterized protein n=1 Tax=Penicillium macrosclerotiorum TaxID=303699 RepID=UPI002546B6BE|nr:uncharacterized protein N7462_007857 [Penicillium macrosclerotiorum]KAJ5679613.1 hypothetical protein N7462_007857 [Penicillium macrosclerotiorum]